MKIERIETFLLPPRWLFVRIEAGGGLVGWGEASLEGHGEAVSGAFEAFDVAVAPHCPLGPLALASCLQLAASAPNVVLQEMSLGIHYNDGADLLTYISDEQVLSPQDGHLAMPDGPGLGVTIDEGAVRSAAGSAHRWRNAIWHQADGSFAEW